MADKNHLNGQFVSVLGYANKDYSHSVLKPKSLKTPINSQAVCNKLYSDNDNQGKIKIALPDLFNQSSILCAGDTEKPEGSCPGDSGKYCLVLFHSLAHLSTYRGFENG